MQPEKDDRYFMEMALRIAERGTGNVEPNPAVGCVIVRGEKVLGKGWHKKFGRAHAEINALRRCREKGNDPTGATMYVTLEPCCHKGKTGPCTRAIIDAEIARVVIAMQDPAPYVSGMGIEKLKNAGIMVETGLCRDKAEKLIAPFIKFNQSGLPWVIIKWAQSRDGFLSNKSDRWISNEQCRQDVHQLRKRCQGILVGINTVLSDDPLLTTRINGQEISRQPLRIILDGRLKIPTDCRLMDTQTAKTLIVTSPDAFNISKDKVKALISAGIEVEKIEYSDGKFNLKKLLEKLAERHIQQLLVEGGPKVITSFLEQDFADEIRIYVSDDNLGKDGLAPASQIMLDYVRQNSTKTAELQQFNSDLRILYI